MMICLVMVPDLLATQSLQLDLFLNAFFFLNLNWHKLLPFEAQAVALK